MVASGRRERHGLTRARGSAWLAAARTREAEETASILNECVRVVGLPVNYSSGNANARPSLTLSILGHELVKCAIAAVKNP